MKQDELYVSFTMLGLSGASSVGDGWCMTGMRLVWHVTVVGFILLRYMIGMTNVFTIFIGTVKKYKNC